MMEETGRNGRGGVPISCVVERGGEGVGVGETRCECTRNLADFSAVTDVVVHGRGI